jgi:hypothetical protein
MGLANAVYGVVCAIDFPKYRVSDVDMILEYNDLASDDAARMVS